MDEIIWSVGIIVLLVIIICGVQLLHEELETPYDKCLDVCGGLYGELKMDCLRECNKEFIHCNKTLDGLKDE